MAKAPALHLGELYSRTPSPTDTLTSVFFLESFLLNIFCDGSCMSITAMNKVNSNSPSFRRPNSSIQTRLNSGQTSPTQSPALGGTNDFAAQLVRGGRRAAPLVVEWQRDSTHDDVIDRKVGPTRDYKRSGRFDACEGKKRLNIIPHYMAGSLKGLFPFPLTFSG